jgi:recombination protein RecT
MATKEQLQQLATDLENNKHAFMELLPTTISIDKFLRCVKTLCINNEKLILADRRSLINSIYKACQDGLFLDGRESTLVTSYDKNLKREVAQYRQMIAGLIKILHDTGEILDIMLQVVYKEDEFSYLLGDDHRIFHKPCLTQDKDNIIGAYAIIKTKDGGVYRDFMSKTVMESVAPRYNGKLPDIWLNHPVEMYKKTVLRRCAKLLPKTADLSHEDDNMYIEKEVQKIEEIKPKKFIIESDIAKIVEDDKVQEQKSTDTIDDDVDEVSNDSFATDETIQQIRDLFVLAISEDRLSEKLEEYIDNILRNLNNTPLLHSDALTIIDRLTFKEDTK